MLARIRVFDEDERGYGYGLFMGRVVCLSIIVVCFQGGG